MTLSVTIYFPAHCSHTGSPDWGDVPQGRLWVESRPRRLRPCAVLWPCTFCSDRLQATMCPTHILVHRTPPLRGEEFTVLGQGDSFFSRGGDEYSQNIVLSIGQLTSCSCGVRVYTAGRPATPPTGWLHKPLLQACQTLNRACSAVRGGTGHLRILLAEYSGSCESGGGGGRRRSIDEVDRWLIGLVLCLRLVITSVVT